MKETKILALESSCDECSAAVVTAHPHLTGAVTILSNVVFSQIDLHQKFGGVVPEIASRNHLEMMPIVIEDALAQAHLSFQELTAVASTREPGLIGALLIGTSVGKALAYSLRLPWIGVNHLEGHLHSLFIADQKNLRSIQPEHLPILTCLVSGGHTALYLIRDLPPNPLQLIQISETRDDAAGEAFDKCAKLLGLPYPGGLQMDQLAQKGKAQAFHFPRALMQQKNLEFSFSGLKTAVALQLKKLNYLPQGIGAQWGQSSAAHLKPSGQMLFDLCASIQEAIVDVLIAKMQWALSETKAKSIAIVGGVSANSRLRYRLQRETLAPIFTPDLNYCTDNAAMIGANAFFKYQRGERSPIV